MRSKLVFGAVLLAGLAFVHAVHAGETDELSGKAFAAYAKERSQSLIAEGQASREVADEFSARCSAGGEDRKGDCEMARSAEEHLAALISEDAALMARLGHELGSLPGWARTAQAAFVDATRRHPARPVRARR